MLPEMLLHVSLRLEGPDFCVVPLRKQSDQD